MMMAPRYNDETTRSRRFHCSNGGKNVVLLFVIGILCFFLATTQNVCPPTLFQQEHCPPAVPSSPPPPEDGSRRFAYFDSVFNAEALIHKHTVPNVQPTPGVFTNFLGIKILPDVHKDFVGSRQGQVEAPPLLNNWHADVAEWAAVFRAVELSGDTFTMMELGAGWGCWLLNAGAAAKQLGKTILTIGVEGDPAMIDLLKRGQEINGRSPNEYRVFRGAASDQAGLALWPNSSAQGADGSMASYGLEAKYGLDLETYNQEIASGNYQPLAMVSLAEAAGSDTVLIDLLHVDIQGAEVNVITEKSMPYLNEHVAYIFVGCHSRLAEGLMHQRLSQAGWILEVDRTAIFSPGTTNIAIDGVQGWRNPRLTTV